MKSFRRRAVGLVVAVAALTALAAPSSAGASAATQWNLNATTVLTGPASWQAPPVSMLHLAMVHAAVYDAVNAIDGGYAPYLVSPSATPFDSQDAAAASAAYHVLTSILIDVPGDQSAVQTTLDAMYAAALHPSQIPDGLAKTRGIAVGVAAANAMIVARTGDGRFGACCFTVPAVPGPGDWRPLASGNDPNGWIRNVTPFLINSAAQFRTKGPWPLTSPQYAREFDEVKALGAKTNSTRTQHQTDAAVYWAQHPGRTWSRIVRGLETERGLSTADGARLYAQIYLTAADSAISVWADKEYWGFWRPLTAIQEAGSDGNSRTDADPTWDSLIASPPYPDHPSGHLGLSGSHIETLSEFFHTDHMAWTDTVPATATTPAITMSYTRLSEALDEIISVRVWSGIHFRRADEQSARPREGRSRSGASTTTSRRRTEVETEAAGRADERPPSRGRDDRPETLSTDAPRADG